LIKRKKTLKLDDDENASLEQRQIADDAANEDLFGTGDGKDVDTSKFEDDGLKLEKKKKKKKGGLSLDIVDDAVDDMADDLDDLNLGEKKKAKKKDKVKFAPTEGDQAPEGVADSADGVNSERPWLNRDLDKETYLYEELLERVYGIIDAKNPLGIGGPQKMTMRPPSLARVGTKKICYTNFRDTAIALKRKEEHLMCFIFAELGTTGNQDAGGQLILKGKFNAKSMEKVLRQYIKDFVRCKTCTSPDTTLEKRDRLYFLKCGKCQSERSVQAIKTGFQAVVGKRSRLRTAALAAAPK